MGSCHHRLQGPILLTLDQGLSVSVLVITKQLFTSKCHFTLRVKSVNVYPPDESQRKQYEEWLQETQQLLQMQQKFLEDQIGAHRKSKKALSAKQRTAKKAGREFPEEDAEQLKHVTEQQSVVQKQLEQVT